MVYTYHIQTFFICESVGKVSIPMLNLKLRRTKISILIIISIYCSQNSQCSLTQTRYLRLRITRITFFENKILIINVTAIFWQVKMLFASNIKNIHKRIFSNMHLLGKVSTQWQINHHHAPIIGLLNQTLINTIVLSAES